MELVLEISKWIAIFFLSVFWIYIVARMIGRAVSKTCDEHKKGKE